MTNLPVGRYLAPRPLPGTRGSFPSPGRPYLPLIAVDPTTSLPDNAIAFTELFGPEPSADQLLPFHFAM